MKKAVIAAVGKQYLVSEGLTFDIDHLNSDKKTVDFDVLLVVDGENITIGAPQVEGAKVTATIVEPTVRADKVTAIRYKAKKRVKKVRGHRQQLTRVTVTKIT